MCTTCALRKVTELADDWSDDQFRDHLVRSHNCGLLDLYKSIT